MTDDELAWMKKQKTPDIQKITITSKYNGFYDIIGNLNMLDICIQTFFSTTTISLI